MVVGYYDNYGYVDLISGDASTQTAAVNQAIASGGDSAYPNPPGSEKHYEDYARPEDSYPTMLQDDYIGKRSPHSNNCIADYMDTSKSTRGNYYGWSWSSDVGPSFINYCNQQNSSYSPTYTAYSWSGGTLTWDVLKSEIDHNRPMVFLVDTDGDGATDHFVPVIGYCEDSPYQYACYTTWVSMPGIRWYTFQGIGHPWGIWGGWSLQLKPFAPTGVSATDGTYCDRVQVSWNSVSGATGYEIWRHTTNNSGSASKIADDDTSPYDDTSATLNVTYYYWIKAKNNSGTSEFSSSDSGYRSVVPVITQHPQNTTVRVGQDANFSVVATGSAPLQYQWKKNDGNVGTDNSTLTLSNVQISDNGAQITCDASNACGMVTSNPATHGSCSQVHY